MLLYPKGPEPFQDSKIYKKFDSYCNRYIVEIVKINDVSDRLTMNYSRYLICIKEKRILRKDEEVDHIDNNKRNDDINNLQILSPSEHKIKSDLNQIKKVHGTLHMYTKYKCRCFLCKQIKKLSRRLYV